MPPDNQKDPGGRDDFAVARAHLSGVTAQYAVARELASAGTIDETAPRILDAILQNLKWELGSIWLADRGDGRLRCVSVQHIDPEVRSTFADLTADTSFEQGVGLPGRVWASGSALWIPDVLA